MENQQLIELMRTVMQKELAPLNARLDKMDERLSFMETKQDITIKSIKELGLKIEGLELNLKLSNRDLQKQINKLQDGQETLITVLEVKGILPKAEGQ